MKLKEYIAKIDKIKEELRCERLEKLKLLANEYINANNPVKIGDMITNNRGRTIKVTHIDPFLELSNNPQCIYSGVQYTKLGKPFKSGKRRRMCQMHVAKHVPIIV